MRELHVDTLAPEAGCQLIARGSAAVPEFIVGENGSDRITVARWRRSVVPLTAPQHMHEHLLSYCAAGAADCTVHADGERLHARQRPRSLTLLRADQSMQWALDAPEDVVHVHLYVSAETVAGFAQDRPGGREPRLRNVMGIRDRWLDSFFRLLLSEYELYARHRRLADSLFLDQTECLLVSYLLSRYAEGARASVRHDPSRASALRPTLLHRVEGYVNENLAGALRLSGMAEVAAMSTGHFSRAFRLATGQSPHQYVLARRLDKAREMLRDRSVPVAMIAQQCGFASAAHFSMVFRDQHAVTPSQYRQAL